MIADQVIYTDQSKRDPNPLHDDGSGEADATAPCCVVRKSLDIFIPLMRLESKIFIGNGLNNEWQVLKF